MIDPEQLLLPATEQAPCGLSLEYDPAFLELEQAAQGRAEQQFGETVIAAAEPDWADVRQRALHLFTRTKDLRVAVYLTRALVNEDGIGGLGVGLGLLQRLLARFWDAVHPQLDANDDNDPTMRLNILAQLVDAGGLLRDLRRSTFIASRSLRLSVRDAEIALGKVPAPADSVVHSVEQVEAMVRDLAAEDMAPILALRSALQEATGLHAALVARVGADRATDLRPLLGLLQLLQQLCDRAIGAAADAAAPPPGDSALLPGALAPALPSGRATGEIASRDDALRALDKVCAYLERHEPSSPAPLLIRRAKRLMTMSFVEIIRDMTPDSMTQVETIVGTKQE